MTMEPTVAAPIRILVVDDHALFREGLVRLLQAETDFVVVGVVASVQEALAIVAKEPVDVVLLDYNLENERGSEFFAAAAQGPFRDTHLFWSAGVTDLEARKLLELGASGIFLKHDPPVLLSKSIRDVAQGRSWFNQELLKELVNEDPLRSSRALTERERVVLRSVVEGLSSKEIGAKMSISESAVKAVLQQLFNKMGVRTRSQLVRVALEQYHGEF